MMTGDQTAKVAGLEANYGNIVETLKEIKTMISDMRGEFVLKTHHDFKVSTLETRVAAIESERKEEREERKREREAGGMMAWWGNVTKLFAGFAVIATVLGAVVTLGIKIVGPK